MTTQSTTPLPNHPSNPLYPPAGFTAPAPQPPARKQRPRWLAVPATALIAAIAASGLTYGVVSATSEPGTAASAITRVLQGDTSNPDWTATVDATAPSVVAIDVQSGQGTAEGSGVILDAQGNIATNNHVVSGARTVWVTLSDRRRYRADVVGTDPSTDLAVIRLVDPPEGLAPIRFGEVSGLEVGQPVMALGNPLGLSETVTTGIISALDRPVVTTQEPGQGAAFNRTGAQQVVTNAIQTSAAINPGNSGGALVNANGELIGITSSIASLGSSAGGSSGNIGIGFAIPADQVKSVTDQLIQSGRAEHALLGVTASDAETTLNGAAYEGAGVQSVSQGAPAAAAGVREGDVIIGVDSDPVSGSEGLIAQIRDRRVDEAVTLRVIRNGREVSVPVTLAAAQ
jgi:putative serine protease PepD